MEQTPFSTIPDNALVENPEPRCASVLLLDVSGSMAGAPLAALQQGLNTYQSELLKDDLAKKRVEIAIVTFGGSVDVVQEFVSVDQFQPPTLHAQGDTPMGQAVIRAVELLEKRKGDYKRNGVGYYRPWILLLTDGEPTDKNTPAWNEAVDRLRTGEDKKNFVFFPVAVEGASVEYLAQLSRRTPLQLKGLAFRELFQWLSASQSKVSASQTSDKVTLPSPTGWAEID